MVALRKLNNTEFVLNADFIESLESTPDTIITLTTGKKMVVRNSIEDIVRKVIRYKQLSHGVVKVVSAPDREPTPPAQP